MDEYLITANIKTLVEQSERYQQSTQNFFQQKKISENLRVNTSSKKDQNSQRHITQVQITDNMPTEKELNKKCFFLISIQYLALKLQVDKSKSISHPDSTKNQSAQTMFAPSQYMLNFAGQNLEILTSKQLKCQPNSILLLDLQNNRLRQFPNDIFILENLKMLNLNSNFIKKVPNDLFKHFSQMQTFTISNNLVNEIPAEIKYWKSHLLNLDVSNNRITCIRSLLHLSDLINLKIQSNEFRILPYQLTKLTKLEEIGFDWFKYTAPSMDVIQKGQESIQNKLFTFLKKTEMEKYEDPSVINFSDDSEELEGITFSHFIINFSEQMIPEPGVLIRKAAFEQDIGVLLSLIQEHSESIDDEDENNMTALAISIKEEKYFSAKTLIYNGALVNKGKTSYGSILNLAMVKGQVHLIADILSHKANTMAKDNKGNTALHYCMALFDRDTKIYTQAMQLLLKNGASPNDLNADGWTPLHLAIKKGIYDAVLAVTNYNKENKLKTQFNLNQKGGKKRQSTLHLACQNFSYEIVNHLMLSQQVNIFARNADESLPHELCASNFRLLKLVQSYESYYLNQFIKRAVYNIPNLILQEDDSSIKDEYEVPYEMDENISLFEGLNHKAFTVCRSLWMDVLGDKDRATYFQAKNMREQSQHQRAQAAYVDRIIKYVTHLQNFFSRAKFECFKDNSKDIEKLYYLSIMLKCFVEMQVLIIPLQKLSQPFRTFTPTHIIYCFIHLLQQRHKLNLGKTNQNNYFLSEPQNEQMAQKSEEKENEKVKNLFKQEKKPIRQNKFIDIKRPIHRKSGGGSQNSQQVDQPKFETSQECPRSPSLLNNSSDEIEKSQNSEDNLSKKCDVLHKKNKNNGRYFNIELIYWSELLIKSQYKFNVINTQQLMFSKLMEESQATIAYESFQVGLSQTSNPENNYRKTNMF